MHCEVTKHLHSSTCFAILFRLGLVAQSVEQRIENPCVGGSIPPRATKEHHSRNANHYWLALSFVEQKILVSGLFPVSL